MSKGLKNALRLAIVVGLGSGAALLIDHIAHYGFAFHLAIIDHGIWGIGLLVLSILLAIGVFRWGK